MDPSTISSWVGSDLIKYVNQYGKHTPDERGPYEREEAVTAWRGVHPLVRPEMGQGDPLYWPGQLIGVRGRRG
jgi:hypothetical protein